ncbi:MAG TPA: DUF3386 family protein, partial [Pirellulaceae bacterium]|nr:DUF3386 family protein [Pirellulaceae bacterium]
MSYLPRYFLALALLATGWVNIARAADTAAQQMERAHNGRVTWQKFPGFQADIVATRDGQTTSGKLVVDVEGEAKPTFREGQEPDWVKRSLQSVINHRLDGGHAVTEVEYADEDLKHPMGRLIRSTKPAEKSLWRVQGDVLTEVQRISDKTRMIISVAEVARNPEGLHMPRSFVTTTWDAQTGAIQSSRQVFQEWKRFGQFDLPIRITAMISTGDGQRHVEEVKLSNISLLPRASTAQGTLSELPELTVPVTS